MALPYSDEEHRRRRRNAAARSRREKRQAIVADLKRCLGCQHCGENDPALLDFHHNDAGQKEFTIAARIHSIPLERLSGEIEKCIVLCANCHRKLHARMH